MGQTDWGNPNNDHEQQLTFKLMNNTHLETHNQMMEDHHDFTNNMNKESFMNDSMNHSMDDAFNAATPSDFGGDSQSIFDNSFDDSFDHSFDNNFDSSHDHNFGGFDGF